MKDLVGKSLGKYRIIEEIGRGGMAAVYKGYDTALERYVAIKVLAPHLVWEKGFVERFLREARAAARLRHRNIVTIHDVSQEGEWYCFVMEYLEGETLTERLRRQGPLPLPEALAILKQVADALDYAHSQGIIHRDVKPGNIIIGPQGQATLTDFGIAKAAYETRLTTTGTLLGTPAYMSPEQVKGGGVDVRTDVYSLGVVTYEMLAGRAPFEGETTTILYKVVHEPPPPLREANPKLLPEVEEVVLRALEKEPEKRYASAGAFASSLAGVSRAEEPTIAAPRERAIPRQGAPAWLWPAMAILILAVCLALALAQGGGPMSTPTATPIVTLAPTPTPLSPSPAPPALTPTPILLTSTSIHTPTPTPILPTPTPTHTPTPTPTLLTPTSTHTPTPTPILVTPTSTHTPPPTPAPPELDPHFRADLTTISAGQCTTLRWDVDNVKTVHLDGVGQVGHGSKQVCPTKSQTFTLEAVQRDGRRITRSITIQVSGTPPPGPHFSLIYKGCIGHNLRLGSVKGQVFDSNGRVIVNAYVEIMVEDQSGLVAPARTNEQGWYEWVLGSGQKVRFVSLTVNGRRVSFSPSDFEVRAESGCFQHVDFVQR